MVVGRPRCSGCSIKLLEPYARMWGSNYCSRSIAMSANMPSLAVAIDEHVVSSPDPGADPGGWSPLKSRSAWHTARTSRRQGISMADLLKPVSAGRLANQSPDLR